MGLDGDMQVCRHGASFHKGVSRQIGQPAEHAALAEHVAPGQAANIAQCRFQSVSAAGKQKEVKLAIQQAGKVAESTQAHLIEEQFLTNAGHRFELHQLVGYLTRTVLVDLRNGFEKITGAHQPANLRRALTFQEGLEINVLRVLSALPLNAFNHAQKT